MLWFLLELNIEASGSVFRDGVRDPDRMKEICNSFGSSIYVGLELEDAVNSTCLSILQDFDVCNSRELYKEALTNIVGSSSERSQGTTVHMVLTSSEEH